MVEHPNLRTWEGGNYPPYARDGGIAEAMALNKAEAIDRGGDLRIIGGVGTIRGHWWVVQL